MSNFSLVARSPLAGIKVQYSDTTVTEVVGKAIISIATPLGGESKLSQAITNTYQTSLPAVGQSTESAVDGASFLGIARNQYFLLFDHETPRALEIVIDRLVGVAYLTDQSDSWVMIRLSGPNSREALSRICSLDFEFSVFPTGSFVRTIMEHHGAFIQCEDKNRFLLFSARSSATSFLHAVETAVQTVS